MNLSNAGPFIQCNSHSSSSISGFILNIFASTFLVFFYLRIYKYFFAIRWNIFIFHFIAWKNYLNIFVEVCKSFISRMFVGKNCKNSLCLLCNSAISGFLEYTFNHPLYSGSSASVFSFFLKNQIYLRIHALAYSGPTIAFTSR